MPGGEVVDVDGGRLRWRSVGGLHEGEEAFRVGRPERPLPDRALFHDAAYATRVAATRPRAAMRSTHPAAWRLVRYPIPVPGRLNVVYRRPREERPVRKPRVPTE